MRRCALSDIALCLALLLSLASSDAWSRALVVAPEQPDIALGATLEVFADTKADFDAVTVLGNDFPAPALTFRRQPPNLGYPKHRHWLRVTLRNTTAVPLERMLVSWRGSAHQFRVFSLVDAQPLHDLGTGTDVVSRHAVTRLQLPAHSTTRMVIQVDSASALALDLRLMTEAELARVDRRDYLWFGLFVGVVLAIAIYVFALFVALRDRLYLLFVAFACGNVVYQFLSEGYLYSWLPMAFRPIGNGLANLSGGMFVIFIVLFVRSFLRLWEISPRTDRLVIKPWIVVILLAFPLFLIRPWIGNTVVALATLCTSAMLPVVSWRAMRHQRPPLALYCAILLFLASGFVHVAKRIGLLADVPTLALVLQIGSALVVIAFSIAVLERVRRIAEENRDAQRSYAARLEQEVAERTRELDGARRTAEAALAEKTAAQRQLVEAEKMASLGQLVAGVAHEVNTPIGVAYTAATYLAESAQRFRQAVDGGAMKRSELDDFVSSASDATAIIGRNLERAAQLIRSFKQVSVDRTSDGRRTFVLGLFLQELTASLRLAWKNRPITLQVQCAPDLTMNSFPGALGQVLTNLIMNALLHAFDADQAGCISIVVSAPSPDSIEIAFGDDGRGVGAAELARIFEPFYTTKRNQGGTGLGLHVVYNLVSQKLGGRISASREFGGGLQLLLALPRVAPSSA